MWDVQGRSALTGEVPGFVVKLYATCERLLIMSSKHRGGTLRLGSTPSMSLKGEKSSMGRTYSLSVDRLRLIGHTS
jgi:hypothetical protein